MLGTNGSADPISTTMIRQLPRVLLLMTLLLEDVMQCWKMLCKVASVFTISMGPEYPGLDDSPLKNGMESH
jgi:hypothetical protein